MRAALAELELPESALVECEDSGVVTVVGDRFSFAHPLLGLRPTSP